MELLCDAGRVASGSDDVIEAAAWAAERITALGVLVADLRAALEAAENEARRYRGQADGYRRGMQDRQKETDRLLQLIRLRESVDINYPAVHRRLGQVLALFDRLSSDREEDVIEWLRARGFAVDKRAPATYAAAVVA
jgi:hypothetical protein